MNNGKCKELAKNLVEVKQYMNSNFKQYPMLRKKFEKIEYIEVSFDGITTKLEEWPDLNKLKEGDIWIIRNQIPTKYYGHKSSTAIGKHLAKLVVSPITKLEDSSMVSDFQKKELEFPVRVAAYFSDVKQQNLLESLQGKNEKIAQLIKSANYFQPIIPFAVVEPPFARRFNLKIEGEISLLQPMKKIETFKTNPNTTSKEIINWIESKYDPIWEEIREDNLYLFLERISLSKMAIFFFSEHKNEKPYSAFKSLAKKYERDNIYFGSIDSVGELKSLAKGLAKKDLNPPELMAYFPTTSKRISYQGEFVLSKLSKWVENIKKVYEIK